MLILTPFYRVKKLSMVTYLVSDKAEAVSCSACLYSQHFECGSESMVDGVNYLSGVRAGYIILGPNAN